MPKWRGDRAQETAEKRARRRLARDEKVREEHARLVVERSHDPRFAQRIRQQDGTTVFRWLADSPQEKQLREIMESQAGRFREKFGRDPGPDDPIFFDPDADEPNPCDPSTLTREMTEELRKTGTEAGIDPAIIEAWCELGYVVTDDNRHLFSAVDVAAWDDAIRRYAGDLDEDDDDLDGEEESDKDPHDLPWEEIRDELERVVAATVENKTLDATRGLISALADPLEGTDETDEEHRDVAIWTFQGTFAVLAGWLSGAREDGLSEGDARSALDWVYSVDNADHAAEYALQAAGLIGHPGAPKDMTVNQLVNEMGPVLVGALALVAAGLVATVGGGETSWLRQFDLGW